MAPDNRRADRVAEAIREEVATYLATGVKDPRLAGLITVTGAEVTRDLRHAKVYVSVLGSEEERNVAFEVLEQIAGYLRGHVGRALHLRVAPQIVFHHDESIARAARIETLLAQIKDERPGGAGGSTNDGGTDAGA
jgi:ribosome-binding factor A